MDKISSSSLTARTLLHLGILWFQLPHSWQLCLLEWTKWGSEGHSSFLYCLDLTSKDIPLQLCLASLCMDIIFNLYNIYIVYYFRHCSLMPIKVLSIGFPWIDFIWNQHEFFHWCQMGIWSEPLSFFFKVSHFINNYMCNESYIPVSKKKKWEKQLETTEKLTCLLESLQAKPKKESKVGDKQPK